MCFFVRFLFYFYTYMSYNEHCTGCMNREAQMEEILFDELLPTFLFAWKGMRTRDELKYHCHDAHIEISYIVSGRGQYRIDGSVYDVSEGDLLIFNPGVYHQALGAKSSFEEYFVGFADVNTGGQKNYFGVDGAPILHTEGELKKNLTRIALAIDSENTRQRPGRYFMLRSYLEQMLVLVARGQSETADKSEGYAFESVTKKYVVEQIMNYFEEHYAEKISLDAIAGNMYLSPYYISRIFKSETGDAPIRHLINIRLERAMELLKSGSCESVREVAGRVGYEDVYHFSKLFKKKYGIPPSKVRADG